MAAVFLVIVLPGFIPDSIQNIQAVEAGQRPPFPWFHQLRVAAIGGSSAVSASLVFAMMVVMAGS